MLVQHIYQGHETVRLLFVVAAEDWNAFQGDRVEAGCQGNEICSSGGAATDIIEIKQAYSGPWSSAAGTVHQTSHHQPSP